MNFENLANDFFVNMDLQTTLALPDSRETILHFCQTTQRQFRQMASFYQRDTGEFVLEGDRDSGNYQWMELQAHRLSAGYFNPPTLQSAYDLHHWLLERSEYFLGIGGLDVESLDLLFGFNLDFVGNRDQIVSQALLDGSPLATLSGEHPMRTIEFQPSIIVALTEDCYTQARLSIETHCNSYQVRTGNYENEPISVYLTVRQFPSPEAVMNVCQTFANQCKIAEDLVDRIVIPNVIQPLAAAIASAG